MAGRRTRITWPDAVYADYAYDLSNQVTRIRVNGNSSATYAYDNLGRRTGITRANGVTTSYGYDAVSRLTSLSHDLPSASDDIGWTYAYNPAGQIISRTASNTAYAYAPATGTTTYVNNGKNQVTSAGGAAITYDANQNITGDGTNAYAYDSQNRLTAVTGVATYAYDPAGRLYEQDTTSSARLLYEGEQPLASYTAGGAVANRYVPGAVAGRAGSWRLVHLGRGAPGAVDVLHQRDVELAKLGRRRHREQTSAAHGCGVGPFGVAEALVLLISVRRHRRRKAAPGLRWKSVSDGRWRSDDRRRAGRRAGGIPSKEGRNS